MRIRKKRENPQRQLFPIIREPGIREFYGDTAPLISELAALYPLSPDAHELVDIDEISRYKLYQPDDGDDYDRNGNILYQPFGRFAILCQIKNHKADQGQIREINNAFEGKYFVCRRNYGKQGQD